jgi:hypothetical protein
MLLFVLATVSQLDSIILKRFDRAAIAGCRRLNATEIRQGLAGNTIRPNQRIPQPSAPYWEDFHANGRWNGGWQSRTIVTASGKWRVLNDSVCVYAADKKTVCRVVLSNKRENSLCLRPMHMNLNADNFDILMEKSRLAGDE